jgi:hypothetical protein
MSQHLRWKQGQWVAAGQAPPPPAGEHSGDGLLLLQADAPSHVVDLPATTLHQRVAGLPQVCEQYGWQGMQPVLCSDLRGAGHHSSLASPSGGGGGGGAPGWRRSETDAGA